MKCPFPCRAAKITCGPTKLNGKTAFSGANEVFPGLWLNADAFVAANLAEVLSVLREELDAAEHQEFVRRLASAMAT